MTLIPVQHISTTVKPGYRYSRTYLLDTLTPEEVRYVLSLFEKDSCRFDVCKTSMNIANGSIFGKYATQRIEKSYVTIQFNEKDKPNFEFFILKFPNAFLLKEETNE